MKVAELQGPALDYWVARADGWFERNEIPSNEVSLAEWCELAPFAPSRQWDEGGPIIEREHIDLQWYYLDEEWSAEPWDEEADTKMMRGPVKMYGPTPLIAAMRAFVALKYGDEVPDA